MQFAASTCHLIFFYKSSHVFYLTCLSNLLFSVMISSFKLIKLQSLVAVFNLHYTYFYMQAKFNWILIIHIWHVEILEEGRARNVRLLDGRRPKAACLYVKAFWYATTGQETGEMKWRGFSRKGHYNLWIDGDPFLRDLRAKKCSSSTLMFLDKTCWRLRD